MPGCRTRLGICAVRFTRLDSTGAPVSDPRGQYVAKGIGSISKNPVYEEGEDVREKDACGTLSLVHKYDDLLIRYELDLEFQVQTYELMEIAMDETLLTDGAPAVVGVVESIGDLCAGTAGKNGVMLETFKRQKDCGVDFTRAWTDEVFSRAYLRRDDMDIDAGMEVLKMTGYAVENANAGNPHGIFPGDLVSADSWTRAEFDVDTLPATSCDYISTST